MFLYYETAEHYTLSNNRNLGHRAWISISQLVKRSERIDTIDAAS